MALAAAAKTRTLFGVLGKLESAYGAATTLAPASDGIEIADLIQVPKQDWVYGGDRPIPDGSAGVRKRLAPQGPELKVPFGVEVKGRAAAFASGSDIASDLDVILQISGHGRTFSTNKQVYAPISTGYKSGAFEYYLIGEKWEQQGAFADLTWEGEAGKPTRMNVEVTGVRKAIQSEASLPTITYPVQAVDPPSLVSSAFSFNSQTGLVLKKFSFKTKRKITRRRDGNAGVGANGGYHMGRREPTLMLEFEAPAFSAVNIYSLIDSPATAFPVSFQVGAAAGNTVIGSFPLCQVIPSSFSITEEDEVALVSVELQVNPSSPTANDDYSITTQ